ncbi:MAG: hypothetical protein MJE77_33010 [Proteobacteria bacterium]|nr:hypothetical protein [Pseudomonadota bacterium]
MDRFRRLELLVQTNVFPAQSGNSPMQRADREFGVDRLPAQIVHLALLLSDPAVYRKSEE